MKASGQFARHLFQQVGFWKHPFQILNLTSGSMLNYLISWAYQIKDGDYAVGAFSAKRLPCWQVIFWRLLLLWVRSYMQKHSLCWPTCLLFVQSCTHGSKLRVSFWCRCASIDTGYATCDEVHKLWKWCILRSLKLGLLDVARECQWVSSSLLSVQGDYKRIINAVSICMLQ